MFENKLTINATDQVDEIIGETTSIHFIEGKNYCLATGHQINPQTIFTRGNWSADRSGVYI